MHRLAKSLLFVVFTATWSACNGVAPEGVEVDPGASADVQSELSRARTYRVTVFNVTAANVLSPPLVVVHSPDTRLFEVGSVASAGLAKVAETGGTDVLEAELAGARGIKVVVKAAGGPILPGQPRLIDVTVPAGVRSPRLNLVAMIGKSNDSFVSRAESLDLGLADSGAVSVSLVNFDAGSEENTGNVEDFGPAGHPTAEAEGLVSYDRGLNPRGNAPNQIAWGATAAVIRIQRWE